MTKKNKIIFNLKDIKEHSKASEKYIDVKFIFEKSIWEGWIPIEYRRAGLFLKEEEEIKKYLKNIYSNMETTKLEDWSKKEKEFWNTHKPNAHITRSFFDVLAKGGWQCVSCDFPSNPNWARRIQDIKDMGYLLSTNTNKYCKTCKANKTHIMIVPVKRFILTPTNSYETLSNKLKKRIITILNSYDVYEAKKSNHLIADHKFPEIRWDKDTKEENPGDMTEDEIKNKFQLLNNQRNLQKREVCRSCYQTNKRGYPFGIPFFYKGDLNWDNNIPKIGKEAEKGCEGCGWYDVQKWREAIIDKIK